MPSARLDGHSEDDIFDVIHNFVMEGRDQRPGMGNARSVNWDKLRDAILVMQRELGKNKTIKRYQEEIDSPKGIIQKMRTDVENRRSKVANSNLRTVIGQEYLDLADLATVVYLETCSVSLIVILGGVMSFFGNIFPGGNQSKDRVSI